MEKIKELLKSIKFWTITGIIFSIFFGFAQLYKGTDTKKTSKPVEKLVSRFDENPSHETNFGFVSINNYISGGDNKIDALLFSELDNKRLFYIFLDFKNKHSGTIKDVIGKVEFPKNGNTSTATFKGFLDANNSKTVEDIAILTDLPKKWKIEFVDGFVEVNEHKLSNGKNCEDTFDKNFRKSSEISDLNNIYIGDLSDYAKGWCHQGFAIATFKIIDLTEK